MSQRSEFNPLGAGALLASVVAVCMGCGALIGVMAGSLDFGIAGGAVVGIPASIGAVVYRYRDGA